MPIKMCQDVLEIHFILRLWAGQKVLTEEYFSDFEYAGVLNMPEYAWNITEYA